MIVESWRIAGGDLHLAGAATRSLKERLKKVGLASGVLRRVMIAAYEAELNVVIHARGGTMQACMEDGRLDLEVVDEGPGIADLERAMEEGYSTASPEARALGFGAGMGLPNIRRSSDCFEIQSEVGRGTRVRSTIFLHPEAARTGGRPALQVRAGSCRSCLACLRACPTQALRVRGGEPQVVDHRCIDCTACIAACPAGALGVGPGAGGEAGMVPAGPGGSAAALLPATGGTLVAPAALLADLSAVAAPRRVLAAIGELGFSRVRLLEEWKEALRAAVRSVAEAGLLPRPVLAPLCPAVANLVELRFPSLVGHLAPFLAPAEAAREAYALRGAFFAVPCPAVDGLLAAADPLSPVRGAGLDRLEERLVPLLAGKEAEPRPADREAAGRDGGAARPAVLSAGWEEPPQAGQRGGETGHIVTAGGLPHVLALLEAAEEGRLAGVEVLELTACPLGCFGSPLLREEAFLGRHRWRLFAEEAEAFPQGGQGGAPAGTLAGAPAADVPPGRWPCAG